MVDAGGVTVSGNRAVDVPLAFQSHGTSACVSMSILGEFTVPASALAMHETRTATPGTTVEIERVVAHQCGTHTPYFWVRGGDMEQFETAITNDPSAAAAERIDVYEDGTLYRATWPPDVESVGAAYLQTDATILEATGRDQWWELRLRFDTHDDVSAFYEYCADHDIPYEGTRIYSPTKPKAGGQFGVTPNSAKHSSPP